MTECALRAPRASRSAERSRRTARFESEREGRASRSGSPINNADCGTTDSVHGGLGAQLNASSLGYRGLVTRRPVIPLPHRTSACHRSRSTSGAHGAVTGAAGHRPRDRRRCSTRQQSAVADRNGEVLADVVRTATGSTGSLLDVSDTDAVADAVAEIAARGRRGRSTWS